MEPPQNSRYYAHPATLEGGLQIGHGRAAYQAMRADNAEPAVYSCIRRDHRWDALVDDNAVYIGHLNDQQAGSAE